MQSRTGHAAVVDGTWDALQRIVRGRLPPEPDLEYRLLQDVGLDSLSFVELLLTLEEAFDIEIGENTFYTQRLETVGDVVHYVEQMLD